MWWIHATPVFILLSVLKDSTQSNACNLLLVVPGSAPRRIEWMTERVTNSMIEWLHWPPLATAGMSEYGEWPTIQRQTDWAFSSRSYFFSGPTLLRVASLSQNLPYLATLHWVSQMGRLAGPKQWNLWTPFCSWMDKPTSFDPPLAAWIQGGVQIGNARLVEIAIAVGVKSGFGCGCLQVATNHQEGNVFLKRDSTHNCDMGLSENRVYSQL